jgi:hypothetical protein
VYTSLFVVTSAHTLLGQFILMLRLVDQTLFLDLLFICVQSKRYPFCVHLYGILLLLVQTLCLSQVVVQLDTTYTHCAWISCTAVHLYFSPVSVHSGTVYKTALYNCTLASAILAFVLSTNHRRASIYLHTLVVHTLCLDQLYCCTFIL